ncbi:insulin-like growth factor-binding protein 5a [Eucyclogobius newberryi]|uniref:insulin-like growth factor-binding protein 5a n=1 Tax=Eucyclogobius newberryi TaxID=166745 RepID=UPI003B5B420B
MTGVFSTMLLCACVLLLLAAACGASYVPCEPCDQKALSLCPPVPVGCQLVKEPGCGCCLTCALEEGQACGVYTGPCTRGLRCLPKNGEEKPLHALLHGRGACANEKLYKQRYGAKDSLDSRMPMPEAVPSIAKVPLYGLDHISSRKAQAMKHASDRRKQLARMGQASHMEIPTHKISKSDPEFGPCRRRLDNLIQSMKDTSRVFALSLYLPNCDKKGFFKRKQCKPSRGRKRGICWCVDKFGVKIPGINYAGGDLQCKDLDNTSNNE